MCSDIGNNGLVEIRYVSILVIDKHEKFVKYKIVLKIPIRGIWKLIIIFYKTYIFQRQF